MYDCHANAWCIRPGKVMGVQLQHFSVGHSFILDFIRSPLVHGGVIADTDLVLAVLLCSVPFSEALYLVMDNPKRLARRASWLGFWHKLRGGNIEIHKAAFAEYIRTYSDHPEPWTEEEKKTTKHESAMPSAAKIAWTLIKAGVPESEAWNMPFTRAMMYYCIEAEFNGQWFVSENELRHIEALP